MKLLTVEPHREHSRAETSTAPIRPPAMQEDEAFSARIDEQVVEVVLRVLH